MVLPWADIGLKAVDDFVPNMKLSFCQRFFQKKITNGVSGSKEGGKVLSFGYLPTLFPIATEGLWN
jgi:hypothetical protein